MIEKDIYTGQILSQPSKMLDQVMICFIRRLYWEETFA